MSANTSLNIITHRNLINTLKAMKKSTTNNNINNVNYSDNKDRIIKNDGKNARENSCISQANTSLHLHSYLPSVSINSTSNTESNHDNANTNDVDEQFVWDTI